MEKLNPEFCVPVKTGMAVKAASARSQGVSHLYAPYLGAGTPIALDLVPPLISSLHLAELGKNLRIKTRSTAEVPSAVRDASCDVTRIEVEIAQMENFGREPRGRRGNFGERFGRVEVVGTVVG